MIDVLSLGAGVQSTCVLLMSCKGVLPKLDAAVFADTGWEPKAVYTHLEWLKGEAERAGIPVHVVGSPTIKEDSESAQTNGRAADGNRFATIPYFTKGDEVGDEGVGQVRRQCTSEYKIKPVDQFLRREIMGLKKGQRAPREPRIRHWFGISADELRRTRISRDRWCQNIYPLPGLPDPMLHKPYTRHDCLLWMREHYPDINPPRSACLCCPYHNNASWRHVRDSDPKEWDEVVAFDKLVRDKNSINKKIYLHRDCVPLDQVDLTTPEDHGQGNLFSGFREECMGVCGV